VSDLALAPDQLPQRVAEVIHALLETLTQAGGGPVTARDVMAYDWNALTVQSAAAALTTAMRVHRLADLAGPGLWMATDAAWEMRRALDDQIAGT
jgi:hypothetical protein